MVLTILYVLAAGLSTSSESDPDWREHQRQLDLERPKGIPLKDL